MSKRLGLITIVLCVSAGVAGCGGGTNELTGSGLGSGTGNGSGSSTVNASPGGVWKGTESVSGAQVSGIADEVGDFYFERSDGVVYAGTATTSGNSLSATFDGYVLNGNAFPDGTNHGTGTLSGAIKARTSITATTQFRTDGGNSSTGSLSLNFDSLYNSVSSLTTISGNFTNPADGSVVTIDSNGTIFSQNAKSGCVLNGTIYIINANYNAYRVVFQLSSCTGQSFDLNGVQFTGLATLDTSVTPQAVFVGVTGSSGSVKYALAYNLNRS